MIWPSNSRNRFQEGEGKTYYGMFDKNFVNFVRIYIHFKFALKCHCLTSISRYTLSWSVSELEKSIADLNRRLIDLEAGSTSEGWSLMWLPDCIQSTTIHNLSEMRKGDNEWKIRCETQSQLNKQLEGQRSWLTQELARQKAILSDGEFESLIANLNGNWTINRENVFSNSWLKNVRFSFRHRAGCQKPGHGKIYRSESFRSSAAQSSSMLRKPMTFNLPHCSTNLRDWRSNWKGRGIIYIASWGMQNGNWIVAARSAQAPGIARIASPPQSCLLIYLRHEMLVISWEDAFKSMHALQ